MSSSNQVLLFLIVGKNEPLYEAEIHKRGSSTAGNSDAVARQSYFVVHSSLDLVEKAAWVTQNVGRVLVIRIIGLRGVAVQFIFIYFVAANLITHSPFPFHVFISFRNRCTSKLLTR
jgi:hypothetical protein